MVGRAVPPAVRGSALLDTGTQMSLINWRIAQALDLAPTRTTLLRTAAGVTTAVCHSVAFSFVANGVIIGKPRDLTVARADILDEDMLIGLDMLRRCHIQWNGPAAEVRLRPVG
ncbi:MAG: retroviral-like aspartic protease family protein [Acidimicrobiaceae bacterium]|nr:retroviral-like aspartic protease family protein [Acidimicrobiaceae bacterium]MDE0318984.1 retroviral-like aspartic protease family protein [Acidimicrobiaceae bacterium]MDE0498645.1 retroviral-like aspartic protease family protein [Acidimicrobiaceae bacterium]